MKSQPFGSKLVVVIFHLSVCKIFTNFALLSVHCIESDIA